MKAFWVIGWCMFLQAFCCCGQEYLFVRYTQKDGLINGRARFIYQDSKGRLYVSTFGGLSVYDGSRFINYSTESGLSTSLVNDIVEMGEDSFLIVPNAHAMHVMVHGIIRDLHTADGFYPVVNQIVKCANGEIYAIADDGLFRFDGKRFATVHMVDTNGKEAGPYLINAVESGRKLFILTDRNLGSYPGVASLLVYDLDSHRLLTTGMPEAYIAVAKAANGLVLVGTENGVRAVDGEALKKGILRVEPPPPPYTSAAAVHGIFLFFDREKGLWISTGKEVLRIDSTAVMQKIDPRGGLPAGLINSVFEDRERNIWMTNTLNGVSRLVNRGIRFYAPEDLGLAGNDLSADLSSDSVWFYDRPNRALVLQTKNEIQRYITRDPLPATGHLLSGRGIWLTGQEGIYQLLPDAGGERFRTIRVYSDPVGFDGRSFFDGRGRLVVATNRLLVAEKGRMWQQPFAVLCDQAGVDRQNRIWAITRADSLLVLEPDTTPGSNRFRRLAAWAGIASSPRSLCVDHDGRIWVGTRDRGLYCLETDGLRIKSSRRLTIEDGLSENFVRYLYCDTDNVIWAATPSGLDRVSLRKDGISVTNMTAGQGLGILKICQSADRTIWAVADGGFLQVSPPGGAANDYRPGILFSQVLVGNKQVPGGSGTPLTLSHDRNAVSFNVGAPSFTDENQTRFSYLLEGGSEVGWSPASRQSAINFVNLPPASYTLHVKAKFLSGMYPDAIGSYPFVIRPPWWQTTTFRIAASIVLLFLIGWAIRSYTLNRLKAQRITLEKEQAIEKERTRIATDMHDDLGAGLSRIKFLSDTIG
ncbi:MAG TPA: two-component regulator propeller domain-containing protein, partial [Puia sp.]|nr:two-component regulator propeller domain-containing protein [Puia sp.]